MRKASANADRNQGVSVTNLILKGSWVFSETMFVFWSQVLANNKVPNYGYGLLDTKVYFKPYLIVFESNGLGN